MRLMLLLALLAFSGCHNTTQVCPNIEILKPVDPIDVNVTLKGSDVGAVMCISLDNADGRICGKSSHTLLQWMKQIRKSENYYIEQITIYNKTFVDK